MKQEDVTAKYIIYPSTPEKKRKKKSKKKRRRRKNNIRTTD